MSNFANKDVIELGAPQLGRREEEAVLAVLRSRWLAQGSRVAEFEQQFAQMHHKDDALAVCSCTAGLHLALVALGIGPGDEVLVPSLTFVATANAVLYTGAKPVFVDIESVISPHISMEDAATKCSPKTRAVIVMHYGGFPVDMAQWSDFANDRGLRLVEDAAHAPGVDSVGVLGDATVFSFFSNKNMTTAEGGMIITRESALLDEIRLLRSHGMTTGTLDRHRGHAYSYDVIKLGWNYRMDELRAAIGLAQLENLLPWNETRRQHRQHYSDLLAKKVPAVQVPFADGGETAAHLMPVVLPTDVGRLKVMEALRSNGIQSSIHYPPVHKFSFYEDQFGRQKLPATEEYAARELTLPLHPGLTGDDVDRVVASLALSLKSRE